MPNPIKYTTGSETNALKKGNFYIGTGDVGKGPSDTTGFYQGISPSSGGYVIYMNKSGAPGDLSYHNAPTDAELISFTNSLAGQSYTTVNECLTYYAGQTDKVCVNRDYEGIVTDGLVLNVDAGFTPSYPKNGTTWYDVSLSGNNGTLTNGPTFSTDGGGSIVFDASDDWISFNNTSAFNFGTSDVTLSFIIKRTGAGWNSLYTKRQLSPFNGNDDIRTYVNGTTLRLYIGSSYQMDIIASVMSTPGIYFIDFVLDRDTKWVIYVNGNFVGENTSSNFTNKASTNISGSGIPYFGTQSFAELFGGNLYSFKIYHKVLSESEVLQNYNAQKGRFGL